MARYALETKELMEMVDALTAAQASVLALEARGYAGTVIIETGARLVIQMDYLFPDATWPVSEKDRQFDEFVTQMLRETETAPATDEDAAPPPAATEAPPPPGPESSSPVADQAAGGEAPPSPPTPEPGQVNKWTKGEDDAVVNIVSRDIVAGLKPMQAYRNAAEFVKRPLEGTRWRCAGILKVRIEEEVARRRRADGFSEAEVAGLKELEASIASMETAPEAAPAPDAQKVEDVTARNSTETGPLPRGEPKHDPMKMLLALDKDLHDHIAGLKRDPRWTFERDAEMLDLMAQGWHQNEIGLEMKMQVLDLRDRLDAITGASKVGGKVVRKFETARLQKIFPQCLPKGV